MTTKIQKIAFPLVLGVVAILGAVTPASAQLGGTTVPTGPANVLDAMTDGAGDLDSLAGLAAAMGMGSTIFGAGALIVKRFIYS